MAVKPTQSTRRAGLWLTGGVLLLALGLSGCQSRQVRFYGGVAPNVPLVTVESVTATKDSPSSGYPIFQFPAPWFPMEMLRAGVTGEVVVRAHVGTEGTVQSASVVRSTQREFELYALRGVERWRFFEFALPAQRSPHGYTVDCLIKFGFDES